MPDNVCISRTINRISLLSGNNNPPIKQAPASGRQDCPPGYRVDFPEIPAPLLVYQVIKLMVTSGLFFSIRCLGLKSRTEITDRIENIFFLVTDRAEKPAVLFFDFKTPWKRYPDRVAWEYQDKHRECADQVVKKSVKRRIKLDP